MMTDRHNPTSNSGRDPHVKWAILLVLIFPLLSLWINISKARIPGGTVLDVMRDVDLSPLELSDEGYWFAQTGTMLTATVVISNTDPSNERPAQLKQLKFIARIPDECASKGTRRTVDFPSVPDVTIWPGDAITYTQSQVFTVPGVYLGRPIKLGIEPNAPWGHFRAYAETQASSGYFVIVDPKADQRPKTDCLGQLAK